MYAGTSYHIGYGNYNRSIKYLEEQIEDLVELHNQLTSTGGVGKLAEKLIT